MANAVKSPPAGSHNPPGFEASLLKELGIAPTPAKVAALNVWFTHEGNNAPPGKNGVNNPLNVSHGGSVDNYTSVSAGVKATANVLRQSNMSKILSALQNPKGTSLQIASAIENSPWASGHYHAVRSQNGTYVGGDLVKSFLPSVPGKPGLGAFLGDVGHYAAHPGAGVEKTAGAAKDAVAAPLDDIAHKILYSLAILGGGMLFIVAMVLIGADIGLEKAGKTKAAKLGGNVRDAFGNGSQAEQDRETGAAIRTASPSREGTPRGRTESFDSAYVKRRQPRKASSSQTDEVPF